MEAGSPPYCQPRDVHHQLQQMQAAEPKLRTICLGGRIHSPRQLTSVGHRGQQSRESRPQQHTLVELLQGEKGGASS